MTPIAKYILVENITEEVKTRSGLFLSTNDIAKERYHKAKVLKVGGDVEKVKEGDIVLYDVSNSYTMLINEIQATIIQEREVVLIY
jgi:co-chaperonin GroES (HSP10)